MSKNQSSRKAASSSNSGKKSSSNVRSTRTGKSSKAKSGSGNRVSPLDDVMYMGSPLSPCAQEYAASLANPFADGPDGACIPDAPALMTRRSKVFVRGTFQTSSNALATGQGYIVCDPLSAIANDRVCLYTNAAAGAAPGITLGTANNLLSNSEYVSANLSPTGIQSRVVSAGLRIRNVTAVLNKGGFVIGLHEPAHTSLNGKTLSNLDAYTESGRFAGDSVQEWTTLLYRPVDTDDLDFQSAFIGATPPAVGQANAGYMGFLVQAPDSTGANTQLYEFEFFVNFETQGSAARGKEPSHADPNGYAAVNAMTVFARNLHAPHQEDGPSLSKAFVAAAGHYLTHHMSDTHPASKEHEKPPSEKKPSVWSNIVGALPAIAGVAAALL